jgi:hypothetical protein
MTCPLRPAADARHAANPSYPTTTISFTRRSLSLDYFVGAQRHRLRDRHAQRLGILHVDFELGFRWLLDGQIGWRGATSA